MKEQQRSTSGGRQELPLYLRSQQSYWNAPVKATSIVALTCLKRFLLHEPTMLKIGKTYVVQSARNERVKLNSK